MRGRVSAALLVLVAVGAAAAAFGFATWGGARAPSSPRSSSLAPSLGHETAPDVDGFEAEVELARGLHAHVRVGRLHAEERRQQFDARVLSQHFGLAAGEPFRLEIACAERTEPASDVAASVESSELSVQDVDGVALVSLAALLPSTNAAPDPLRALLAARRIEFVPGSRVALVMWGRTPKIRDAGPTLTGLTAAPVLLAAAHWPADPLQGVLARVPAPVAHEVDAAEEER